MSVAAAPLARRPLGCCVQMTMAMTTASTMATRRAARRFASTVATTSPSTTAAGAGTGAAAAAAALPTRFQAIAAKGGRIRTAFAVYEPSQPSSTATPASPILPSQPSTSSSVASSSTTPAKIPKVDVLRAYDQQQIARMDPTGARTQLFSRKNPDSAKPGDVLLVTPSKAGAEAFAGVCLAVRRSGIETAILLRGQLAKTGVEMWFKIYSRAVAAIDIIQRRPRRARRAKLTYMRQPKHDRGSVDDLVKAWRRSRNVMRTRGAAPSASAAKKAGKK